MFSLQLTTITIILLVASTIPMLFLLFFYRKRIASIDKQRKASEILVPDSDKLPAVSVIVYSDNDADSLAQMLPDILSQDYPSPMEVIVVNDGSCEATKDIVERLEMTNNNLYLTFTPDKARNLSRKKLALTIGIKAAKNDIVVLTNANVRIKSPHWLASITRHFSMGKDIVIGYGAPSVNDDQNSGNRLRAFDIAVDATTYLSAAIIGTPYRSNGNNLAYRRQLFFNNKGFSRAVNLHFGDDDIFINEVATKNNTAVELHPESQVSCQYFDYATSHRILKQRYNFTARYLRQGARRFFGFSSLMMWTWSSLSATAIITALPNLLPLAIVTSLALILWLPIMFTWRKTLNALNSRRLFLTIPWLLHYRPIYNLIYRIRSRHSRHKNFTWEH